MKQLTQTRDDNCWQTCVAMLIDREPGELPEQAGVDDPARYAHMLQMYLRKHHNMTYRELSAEAESLMVEQNTYHLMIGETERMNAEHDVWHAVVGFAGKVFWDVHPSRAGLTKILRYGVIVPIPYEWRSAWRKREAAGDPDMECRCSTCEKENCRVVA